MVTSPRPVIQAIGPLTDPGSLVSALFSGIPIGARGRYDVEVQLADRMGTAMNPFGGTVVDVSAQRITLRLTGSRARDVLAKGCSIDLHPRSFRRGDSAQTMLAQAGVILLALSDSGDDYAVLVRSSYAGYLADWLADAALEFTCTTVSSQE